MNELKTRGVEDILIVIVDGLKGLTPRPPARPVGFSAAVTRDEAYGALHRHKARRP